MMSRTNSDESERTLSEGNDWQAFVATLDGDLLECFEEVMRPLPSATSPHAIIARIDLLVFGTAAGHEAVDWGVYVDRVLELARLRNALRAWFFERGGYENERLNAFISNLVLDSRTRLVHVAPGPSSAERPPARLDAAFMKAVPLLFLLVTLLALTAIATTMALRDVVEDRNATAAVALCVAVAMLAMGTIVSAMRDRSRRHEPDATSRTASPDATSRPAGRGLLVTRDSVGMADDVRSPHPRRIEIDPDADALTVANTILASGYLPEMTGGSTWSISLGDAPDADMAVFGHHAGTTFAYRVDGGMATLRSAGVARIKVRYHGQDRPDHVIGELAMARQGYSDTRRS